MTFCECHQFLKIPFLIQHFQKHVNADPSMNFGKFVQVHYLSSAVITDDFQQDEQLPFRCVHCNVSNITCYIYEPVSVSITSPSLLLKTFYNYDETNKAQLSAFDIFQPPRRA
jgi:hypothetical protein